MCTGKDATDAEFFGAMRTGLIAAMRAINQRLGEWLAGCSQSRVGTRASSFRVHFPNSMRLLILIVREFADFQKNIFSHAPR